MNSLKLSNLILSPLSLEPLFLKPLSDTDFGGSIPPIYNLYSFIGAYKAETSIQNISLDGELCNIMPKGTVSATSIHPNTIYAPDVDGVLQAYTVNLPVWKGIRLDTGIAYATDISGAALTAPFLATSGSSTPDGLSPVTLEYIYPAANIDPANSNISMKIDWAGDDIDILDIGTNTLLSIVSGNLYAGQSIASPSPVLDISNIGLVTDAAGGTLVNGRSSIATITDFEGNVVDCMTGELRYDGGRRLQQLTAHNFSLDLWSSVSGGSAIDNGDGTFTVSKTAASTSGRIKSTNTNVVGSMLTVVTVVVIKKSTDPTTPSSRVRIAVIGDTTVYSSGTVDTYDGTGAEDLGVYWKFTIDKTFTEVTNITSITSEIYANTILEAGSIIVKSISSYVVSNPELIDSDIIYNAGIPGIKYFDTGIDGSTPLSPSPKMLHEGAGTNYAFPASTPATQIITLVAGDYTAWLDDTDNLGTVTLTGGATGVANSTDTNGFQFTASGAAITFTHAGSNNVRWQVEGGNYRTSFIDTTTAALSRAEDRINLPLALGTNFDNAQGVLVFDWETGYVGADFIDMGLLGVQDAILSLLGAGTTQFSSHDGTNAALINSPAFIVGDSIKVGVCWSSAESLFSINYSLDNGVTWGTWVQATYDGAFTTGALINLFYSNPYINKLNSTQVYGSLPGGNIASAQIWINSGQADTGLVEAITIGTHDIEMNLNISQVSLTVDNGTTQTGPYTPVTAGDITVREDHWQLTSKDAASVTLLTMLGDTLVSNLGTILTTI